MLRRKLRRLTLGLATLFGARKGYVIPVRHAGRERRCPYEALAPIFAAAPHENLLHAIERHAPDLRRILKGKCLPARLDQDWFPRLDALAAYAMVREAKPMRIVEIGSGHSTRFLARAIADGGLGTRLTCIDPKPRADIAALNVDHRATTLEDADPALFAELKAGDILFIDSSHVAMPGSDVDQLFLDILPALPAGVIVHVHDIFLPDAYPVRWLWRGYNEQLLVGALLQGRGFELLFSSRWVATRAAGRLAGILAEVPLKSGAFETSVWLRKT